MARPAGRTVATLGLLGVAIVSLFAVSCLVGGVWLPPTVVWAIVAHQLTAGTLGTACGPYAASSPACTVATEIVWDGRVPAILVAVFAGAALALSGGTLQGLFRNPLADPFLLGLSSGAATGTAILFSFDLFVSQQALFLPVFAFAGALVPGLLVYALSRSVLRSPETLVLTGVALTFIFSAVLATFLFYNPAGGLQVSFWLLGSLSGESWSRAGLLAGAVLAVGAAVAVHGRELDVLQLGPDVAHSVGVETTRVVRRLVLLTTLLTATAVAFTGVIGFVGLVSPHVVRRLIGADYRRVLPAAALFGGLFLLGAWDLAQSVIPTVVVPVGIPTALVGGPSLLYLLYRRGGRPT